MLLCLLSLLCMLRLLRMLCLLCMLWSDMDSSSLGRRPWSYLCTWPSQISLVISWR